MLIRAHEIDRIYAVKYEDRRTFKEDAEVPGKITSSLPDVRQFVWFMLPVFRLTGFRETNSRTYIRCDLDRVQISRRRSHLILFTKVLIGVVSGLSLPAELCVL